MWSISQQPMSDWYIFLEEFRAYEVKISLKEKEDALLDVYSLWLKSHDDALKEKIIKLAKEIKQLDSGINLDELIRNLDKVKV